MFKSNSAYSCLRKKYNGSRLKTVCLSFSSLFRWGRLLHFETSFVSDCALQSEASLGLAVQRCRGPLAWEGRSPGGDLMHLYLIETVRGPCILFIYIYL